MISIIIINEKENTKYLYDTVRSIEEKISNVEFEIIVVNLKISAEDETREKLRVYSLNTQNFAKAKNFGVSKAKYETLLFLYAGIIIKLNPFIFFFEKFKNRKYGAVALKLYDYKENFKINFGKEIDLSEESEDDMANKKISAGDTQKMLEVESRLYEITSVARVYGNSMVIKKNVFLETGGYNEYLLRYYDDADLCKRLTEKKYTNYFYPFCKLVDLSYEDFDLSAFIKSRLRYYKLHNSFFSRGFLRTFLFIKYFLLSLTFGRQSRLAFKSVLFPY